MRILTFGRPRTEIATAWPEAATCRTDSERWALASDMETKLVMLKG